MHSRTSAPHLFILALLLLLAPTLHVAAQSKGPGPRAGHCVVEHDNVLYFLGGTPPTSPSYAAFTSLKLPLNSVSVDPDTLPWLDLPNPPVAVQITNLTMSFSSQAPTLTPSWIDCFATDDGRIVVVGGSFQILVYNIGTSTWGDTVTPATSIKFGPSVTSNMFLNPVYIQSRILADGYTALVVCTLTWNSQPQPYYLDTRTWTVTLAIGTAQTTPVGSASSSSGWGAIPGGGTPLPPSGFRHYTLAILGQDKSDTKNHYGNGRAFIIGGYSTLVTGQVQDWDALSSFPVQQAPSNVVVMFGNSGSLSKPTRGSAAYATSFSILDIFPGNGGATGNQQRVEAFDKDRNAAAIVSGINGGPKNTIFRGATVIGQGAQVFVHGGLSTLDFDASQSSLLTKNLDQSIGVWNGDSRQWGDTVNTYVPKKSKGWMIGLIVGGIVLLALIIAGVWYFRKRRRMRLLEEEERQAKGMVLKNEEKLQKEHRTNHDSPINNPGTIAQARHLSTELSGYGPLQPGHGYADGFSTGRNSSHSHYPYVEADIAAANTQRRTVNGPQEYPPDAFIADSSQGASVHYQPVVTTSGYPVPDPRLLEISGTLARGPAKTDHPGVLAIRL
ncbi:hypothetical protein BGX31_005485 [Mortierella sp. GBA43]|nr:hypothetical protein BGX31_005485 [Mortierella sp. GBA43]